MAHGHGLEGAQATHAATAEVIPSPEGKTWNRVLVVHNRLPFKLARDREGKLSVVASTGGLVTAMASLVENGVGGKWIGWPGTDDLTGLEDTLQSQDRPYDLGIVPLTKEEEEQYYHGYSNEVLTPIFVGQPDKVNLENADKYWEVYQRVQKKFAEKIIEDIRPGDIIWVHDWHLFGVGVELMSRGVKQPTGFFLHIPFPSLKDLEVLPHKEAILRDMLAYDLVGFQTKAFRQNFLEALKLYVPETEIHETSDGLVEVTYYNRTIRVGAFPISIDPAEFTTQLTEETTQRNLNRLNSVLERSEGVQLIFNVGRQDYAKGFYEELLAFDRLLEKHPELIGKVILYQLVVPSREVIPAYKEYKEKIIALAKSINEKYKSAIVVGEDDSEDTTQYPGRPVRQVHGAMARPRYLAHLAATDIQSIPTKADGMNLVAKEGALVGKPTMVQILGKVAGAAEELGDYSILIDPDDIEAFADALYQSYVMAEEEKRQRKAGMEDVVTSNDVFGWWTNAQEPAFQKVWDDKQGR
jgi:trehalose-6-phosphate synthase